MYLPMLPSWPEVPGYFEMYHIFLIHSFTDGHLGCFQNVVILSRVAMNKNEYINSFELVSKDS